MLPIGMIIVRISDKSCCQSYRILLMPFRHCIKSADQTFSTDLGKLKNKIVDFTLTCANLAFFIYLDGGGGWNFYTQLTLSRTLIK